MNQKNLDNLTKIKQLDKKNMLASLESLAGQVKEVWAAAKKIKIAAFKIDNIVVLGMGGSGLGAHIVRSVFGKEIKAPLSIVHGYHCPGFVSPRSLVIAASYSGNTEEVLSAFAEAKKKKAKLAVIAAGGALAVRAKKEKIPAAIFTTKNNPCGSPRMGLGYAIFGLAFLLAKFSLMKFGAKEAAAAVATIARAQKRFGPAVATKKNPAKRIALKVANQSVWFVSAEHLSGNAHVAANQMNENAKRFSGYFLIPELNHHLLEGMLNPASNKKNLFFVFLESKLFDQKNQKRFSVTKSILSQNKIVCESVALTEKTKFGQALEAIVFSGYASFYSAMAVGIDPTPIPFVDYFKKTLAK